MSLNGIAASALSALKTNSAALGVVSNNVANLNTPGYARRVVNEQTLALNGQLVGVDIASVERVVDQFLQSENLAANGTSSQYDTMAGMFTQLNGLLGGPGDNQSLATGLTNLAAAYGIASQSPSIFGQLHWRAQRPQQCGVADFQRLQHHHHAAEPGGQPGGQRRSFHQCADPADLSAQSADQERHGPGRRFFGPGRPARCGAQHAQPDHGHPGQSAVRWRGQCHHHRRHQSGQQHLCGVELCGRPAEWHLWQYADPGFQSALRPADRPAHRARPASFQRLDEGPDRHARPDPRRSCRQALGNFAQATANAFNAQANANAAYPPPTSLDRPRYRPAFRRQPEFHRQDHDRRHRSQRRSGFAH